MTAVYPVPPYRAIYAPDPFVFPGTDDVGDLQVLPSHLGVGMGVVDVRSEILPNVEQIVALVAAGLKILPANRIALNPDCGFAPDAGEPPTLDEAYEKLRQLVTAAKLVRETLANACAPATQPDRECVT